MKYKSLSQDRSVILAEMTLVSSCFDTRYLASVLPPDPFYDHFDTENDATE